MLLIANSQPCPRQGLHVSNDDTNVIPISECLTSTNMPDRFQVTKADEDTALDYNQDESASGKLLGDIHDETLGENYGSYDGKDVFIFICATIITLVLLLTIRARFLIYTYTYLDKMYTYTRTINTEEIVCNFIWSLLSFVPSAHFACSPPGTSISPPIE